ncbi:hypothetical protein Hanom_Chr04g00300821 [Helianthus anomalus]
MHHPFIRIIYISILEKNQFKITLSPILTIKQQTDLKQLIRSDSKPNSSSHKPIKTFPDLEKPLTLIGEPVLSTR